MHYKLEITSYDDTLTDGTAIMKDRHVSFHWGFEESYVTFKGTNEKYHGYFKFIGSNFTFEPKDRIIWSV